MAHFHFIGLIVWYELNQIANAEIPGNLKHVYKYYEEAPLATNISSSLK